MALPVGGKTEAALVPSVIPRPDRGLLASLVLADASPLALVLLAGLPVLAAAWALLSPDRVLSYEMTWDLLFNLAGAWHLHSGHVPHIDFHEPVGELNFLLTQAGFYFFGPTPHAFLAGTTLAALAVFVAATTVALRRLPLLPAAIFVVYVCLLVLRPSNIGDLPNAYSFAMSYNRYCWSALNILALILFLPARHDRAGAWSDVAIAGALLMAMFYLKVTYFAAGLAALGLALLICRHVRVLWPVWIATGLLVLANAAAPYSHSYLSDIWAAATAGGVRSGLASHLNKFFAGSAEYAPYVAALAVATWMWWVGRASLRLPVATGFLFAVGALLLTQNAQSHGIPTGIMIAFLLYEQFRQRPADERLGVMAPLLLALLVFPLFSIGTSTVSLAGYRIKAAHDAALYVVDRTNLRGLAVPSEQGGLLAAFSGGNAAFPLLNRARVVRPRYELSQYEYIETILEAAALLADGRHRPGDIALLDQVNPLPFMLGLPPPRGGNLWSGFGAPAQPAERLFADVDYVLIPKFSSYSPWTEKAMIEYGPYLSENFSHREETQSWILLSHDGAATMSLKRSQLIEADAVADMSVLPTPP